MCSRGKGDIPLREIQRTLGNNGYRLARIGKHFIYKNDLSNDTFILPRSCHSMLIRRMYKEHNIHV